MNDFIEQTTHPGDCILFSTADWDEPYWTNKQHCAEELIRLGWRVLYVESIGLRAPIVGSKKDLNRLLLRLRKGLIGYFFGATNRDKHLWVLSPLVFPGAHNHKWIGRFNQFLLQWSLNRHIKTHSFTKPLIWTYHPYILTLIKRLQHKALIYHCVDDLTALPGINVAHFSKAEEELLNVADIIFVTSISLQKKCQRINDNTYFFPNVVDFEHFIRASNATIPEDLAKIPEPRLIYHGVLSDFKVDFDLLLKLAKKKPNWNIILIGEEREGQGCNSLRELQSLSNVYMLGFKKYNDLPKYLMYANVGLLPSNINVYTKSMFPMKYFEYLASGLPIVSTPLEFTKSHKEGLLIANDLNGFIVAVDMQLQRGKLDLMERKKIIGDNTWSARMKKMLNLINKYS